MQFFLNFLIFISLQSTVSLLNNGIGNKLYKIAVIGASGGVGQQISSKFLQENCVVTAIGRSKEKMDKFELLSGCNKIECSTKDSRGLATAIEGSDAVVISVGTTAFPTKAWESGQNNPKAACYDTVADILATVKSLKKKPSKIALLTSIGVDRVDKIPFKILNSFGVLTEKKRSEQLLIKECSKLNILPVICRPGRLIGEPFTNLDLAKLFKVDRKENKYGVLIEKSETDRLVGDVTRKDVAYSLYYLLRAETTLLQRIYGSYLIYSIVNCDGNSPLAEGDWRSLLLTS